MRASRRALSPAATAYMIAASMVGSEGIWA